MFYVPTTRLTVGFPSMVWHGTFGSFIITVGSPFPPFFGQCVRGHRDSTCVFPELGLHDTDPAQQITSADKDLDDLSVDDISV